MPPTRPKIAAPLEQVTFHRLSGHQRAASYAAYGTDFKLLKKRPAGSARGMACLHAVGAHHDGANQVRPLRCNPRLWRTNRFDLGSHAVVIRIGHRPTGKPALP